MSSTSTTKIADITVPLIGWGSMSLGNLYGYAGSDDERMAFLDHAVAIGATHWDLADIYMDVEDVVGKWLKRDPGNRSKVTIVTKFGFVFGDEKKLVHGEPEYVKSATEKSLQRLGIDQIDLLYLHRADSTIPIEKTVGAMAELVREGKVRHLGLSEVSARRAHAVHPISAVQVEYSVFNEVIETNGTWASPSIAYSPIGRGIVTGEIKSFDDLPKDDWRRTYPKYQPENFPKINALVGALEASQSPVIPIPGTSKVKRLDENHNAATIKLTAEDIEAITKAGKAAEAGITGDAYPEGMQQTLFVDTPPLQDN
ncbi:Aldo/keto reductase [Flagelloscypha sp. PMI_526]|nr:Aldo/keto reductase [Flagelloscypha sp. PMI_526]